MAADLRASAYLADGVDLAADGVELTHEGSGLWAPVGESLFVNTYPGVDGGDIDGGVFSPFTLPTMYRVSGTDATDVWAKVVAFLRRCKPGRTVTLARQMPDPDGTDANVGHTATARRQGPPRVQWLDRNVKALVDVDWAIADGIWYGAAVAIADAAGAHTIDGDASTHRMTLTLAAGAARTITNTTAGNGHSFDFITAVPTGGVLVDVEACTATAITGGADMSKFLRWSKKYPMQLDSGSNILTVSAGSASIDYQPAYL
jgi:hypothetical protein